MRSFVEYFKENFYQKLLTPSGNNPVRNRADSLLSVFEILVTERHRSFYILETGCMRPDHGVLCFGDDGCSTWIFDKFLEHTMDWQNCGFISIDNNEENIKYSKGLVSKDVEFICGDSINSIYNYPADNFFKLDLIYLDSLDVKRDNPHLAQLHALKELAVCMPFIYPGTIIIVDDYDAFAREETDFPIGKGNYVQEFLDNIGANLLYQGYQVVYRIDKW